MSRWLQFVSAALEEVFLAILETRSGESALRPHGMRFAKEKPEIPGSSKQSGCLSRRRRTARQRSLE
jgi:hypothetical protein